MLEEIGKKIRSLRKSQKLTTSQLAKMAGVSQSTISDIENGKHSTTLLTIIKLCDVLQIDLTDLIPKKTQEDELNEILQKLSPQARKSLIDFLNSILDDKH